MIIRSSFGKACFPLTFFISSKFRSSGLSNTSKFSDALIASVPLSALFLGTLPMFDPFIAKHIKKICNIS